MRHVALSMQGAPLPRPRLRAAAAAACAAACGVGGWSLARWQASASRAVKAAASGSAHNAARSAELRKEVEAGRTTPLHAATALDDAEAVRALLDAAPDPKAAAASRDKFGFTPLYVAAANGSAQAAKVLLDAAPEAALVRCHDDDWTPLHAGQL